MCGMRLSWTVALTLISVASIEASAQAGGQPARPMAAEDVALRRALWARSTPDPLGRPSAVDPGSPPITLQVPARRSASRTIATHAAVGAGAGVLIGLVLEGANLSGSDASLVLTWGAVGLGAGLISGVLTWLMERPSGGG